VPKDVPAGVPNVLESVMDIATAVGLVAGFGTLISLVMIDGGNIGISMLQS
jgi:hypothetical protein